MNVVNDVWFSNERTSGDWVLFGFRIDNHVGMGTMSDSALAELFLKPGDGASDEARRQWFLRALRNYMRHNPNVATPALCSPLNFG